MSAIDELQRKLGGLREELIWDKAGIESRTQELKDRREAITALEARIAEYEHIIAKISA